MIIKKTSTILILGGMTYAMKAKRLLMREGIRAKVIKIDEDKTQNGCSHGIEIEAYNFYSAVDILRRADLSYTVYEER